MPPERELLFVNISNKTPKLDSVRLSKVLGLTLMPVANGIEYTDWLISGHVDNGVGLPQPCGLRNDINR